MLSNYDPSLLSADQNDDTVYYAGVNLGLTFVQLSDRVIISGSRMSVVVMDIYRRKVVERRDERLDELL